MAKHHQVTAALKGEVMIVEHIIHSWEQKRIEYFSWMHSLTWRKRLLLGCVMAIITGMAAQLRVPLPFTPVPITGQVCAVLLAGVLLGNTFGGISMVMYVAAGFAGIPWFTNASTGIPIGPTTGYLIGFIPAAFFIGWISKRLSGRRTFIRLIALMALGVLVIYLCGALHFSLFMKTGILTTLSLAVLPFILVDVVKILIAATLAQCILPRKW